LISLDDGEAILTSAGKLTGVLLVEDVLQMRSSDEPVGACDGLGSIK
jgi:predicted RNA-binding protein